MHIHGVYDYNARIYVIVRSKHHIKVIPSACSSTTSGLTPGVVCGILTVGTLFPTSWTYIRGMLASFGAELMFHFLFIASFSLLLSGIYFRKSPSTGLTFLINSVKLMPEAEGVVFCRLLSVLPWLSSAFFNYSIKKDRLPSDAGSSQETSKTQQTYLFIHHIKLITKSQTKILLTRPTWNPYPPPLKAVLICFCYFITIYSTCQLCTHLNPIAPIFALCAWQIAIASASATSSGLGTAFRPSIILTMFCICALSARP